MLFILGSLVVVGALYKMYVDGKDIRTIDRALDSLISYVR